MSDHRPNIQGVTLLEREAHDWVRYLALGEVTEADAERLRRWCAQSDAHAAAFHEARQFWTILGSAGQDLREDEARLVERQRTHRVLSRRMMLGGALAASVAGVATIRPPLDLWPSIFELEADYRTGVGEQRQIAIADAASVQMNTRTSLSMRGGGDARLIELVSGEASFRISHQAEPFSVLAAGGRTSAVDAQFDVRIDGTSACVTCLSDHVDIVHGNMSVQLKPHQRIRYNRNGFGEVAAIDPSIASAWRQGLIICSNTPLSEVVAELNRYRSGRIVLLRSELGRLSVSGRFRIAEPDQALLQIQKVFGVHIRSLPGGLALLS